MEIYKPVTGVAADSSQARVVVCDVPDKPGISAKLFSALAEKGISVDMIIQSYARKSNNTNDIAFTVSKDDIDKTLEIVESISKVIGASNVHVNNNIAKVSIVGAGMVDRPGIAADMFKALADAGINIKMISTSEIKISCLVDKNDEKEAIKALHEAFSLGCDEVAEVKGDLPNF